MNIVHGQCGCCEKVAEYSMDDLLKPAIVACSHCQSKSVWRKYTNAELDQLLDKIGNGEKL
jgi:hypothetical protein